MLSLESTIVDLSAKLLMRSIGAYVCALDYVGEPLGLTVDIEANQAHILGAAPYSAEDLKGSPYTEMVSLSVPGRNQYPLVASATTKVAIDRENGAFAWVPLGEVAMGDHVIIPDIQGQHLVLMACKPYSIRSYRQTLSRVADGAGPTLCRLKLRKAKSFATPCAMVRCY